MDTIESYHEFARPDHNSKISVLINVVKKMSQKPTIESDLSQVLEEFLQKLNECDKYLQNGIFNMNFAEAALLLQSSVDIYSKKVDMLWDIIFDYQKRMLLNDDQNANKEQEIEKLEERKRKYKRKQKNRENVNKTTKLINTFSFGNTENVDYLSQSYEQHDLLEEWKKFQVDMNDATCNIHSSNKNSLFMPNNPVYTEDNDHIGKYYQFHSASLIEDIFQLEKDNLIGDEYNCITQMRMDCYVINDFLLENGIPCNKPLENYATELNKYFNHFNETRIKPLKNIPESLIHSNHIPQPYIKESFVSIEKLPFNVLKEKLRRTSVADSLFDDDNMSSVSNGFNNDENPAVENSDKNQNENEQDLLALEHVAGSFDKRNKSCSQDSAFYELEDGDELRNTPITPTMNLSDTNRQLCSGGEVIIPRNSEKRMIKRKAFLENLEPEDFKENHKKRRVLKKRLSEKALRKLVTGITVSSREFEKFFRFQYKPGENEGTIPPDLSDSEESDDNGDDSDEEDAAPCYEDNVLCPDPDLREEDELNNAEISENPPEPDPPRSVISIPPPQKEKVVASEIPPEAEEMLRKNVREWRAFILPKLKAMENCSDFDIHEYGSKIMEPMKIGEEKLFKNIVAGKSAGQVARFFVAALQLANTNNVEIHGAVPAKLATDTFKIKTVDKTRYHELLEDYQAPSEETFLDRLEKAKAMNPNVPLHSTPMAPPSKKMKFREISKKKLF